MFLTAGVEGKGGEKMIESLANKEERYQAEGLTLEELEGQTVQLLPKRLEMHRHHTRRNIIINNITINCSQSGAAGIISGCNG